MATKKKAAKKSAPRKRLAPKGADLKQQFQQIAAIVNGPNTPRGAVDELESYMILNTNKGLEMVRAILTSAHTSSEIIGQLQVYLKDKV